MAKDRGWDGRRIKMRTLVTCQGHSNLGCPARNKDKPFLHSAPVGMGAYRSKLSPDGPGIQHLKAMRYHEYAYCHGVCIEVRTKMLSLHAPGP